ncbi:hypothetical protein ZYGR_0P00710 [Zygosaccharomyces rouxii]|uniref:Glucosidase II subunit alpha n=2 Tax=Zygosaccharomyces rouxii TaxID=4956 RepID=C5E408_ZYGRC|nr:uncharacterized protein ZYRO0E01782g [Zygosaccharomyces rouxii]KAH9198370.1 glycosyl hydrolases family 31-domain-containing protein [Zygosaccharomyces rouxii]GAV49428.1 hypothetical protein ZYGR_0P00710 [Zygosaccharomyces rouxii]CAR30769.1 ZYRO0E01782p [Zygosaccharomyces rouxii]
MLLHWFLQVLFFWSQLQTVSGFTQYLLKRCDQAGFCTRNRYYAENIQKTRASYYTIEDSSVHYDESDKTLYATIIKSIPPSEDKDSITKIELPFALQLLQDGSSVRFIIDENRPHKDYLPEALNQRRYNETSKWAFTNLHKKIPYVKKGTTFNKHKIIVEEDPDYVGNLSLELFTDSFLIKVYWKDELAMVVNERSLLNYEHLRAETENEQNLLPEESDFNMFHDNFKYSKADTLPFGPESVALDFAFNGIENLYGLPEHPDSFRLKDTTDGEPYRLYSTDVFRYDIGTKMPMYGNIPFVIGNNPKAAVGLFWVNAADTWVDLKYQKSKTQTHWMSETGVIDVVLFFADTPDQILNKYTNLTGRPMLPKQAAVGYHQCRWNYNDELDVLTVDSNMDKGHFPYDIIWLDIDYTDEKKFFTWKPSAFPNPARMLKKLAKLGRELVVLIDPHLKAGYEISDEIIENDVAIKNQKGKTFYGTCWPGRSVWIDTFSELGRKVWGSFYDAFLNGAKNLNIWNDMNEPSIFDGPETTAPKNLIHDGGFEHRALHNAYSLTVHEATHDGLLEINNNSVRPFIIARGYFTGSQRTAGTWTGDNVATWDYLRVSLPMILSSNVAGMPFTGADIAGFFENPEDELVVRWYQAGLWYPFFRAHAHIDSNRREPFLFKDPIKSYVRDAIQLRYTLLPTFYTAFFRSSIDGTPIMKPMIFEKPQYPDLAAVDDQFYLGNTGILVKPILEKDVSITEIKVSEGVFYDYYDLKPHYVNTFREGEDVVQKKRAHVVESISVRAGLDKIPILLEGGHIITKRDNYRRSSKLYRNDPYTLVIAPDSFGDAEGELYADDGETLAHKNGEYLHTVFTLQHHELITGHPKNVPSDHRTAGNTMINKIVIATGNKNRFNIKDTVKINRNGNFHTAKVIRTSPFEAVILHPMVYANETWQIDF